jgi:hypothetical protein
LWCIQNRKGHSFSSVYYSTAFCENTSVFWWSGMAYIVLTPTDKNKFKCKKVRFNKLTQQQTPWQPICHIVMKLFFKSMDTIKLKCKYF